MHRMPIKAPAKLSKFLSDDHLQFSFLAYDLGWGLGPVSFSISRTGDLMRRHVLTAAIAIGGLMTLAASGRAEKIPLDKVPAKVMAAINARFPDQKLKSVEKETEDGAVVFDVELSQKGRKYEADIKEDGTIVEIEKEVAAKDFPAACAKAIAAKFPNAKVKEIMEINKVDGAKETPQNYEVVLEEPGKKSFEAVVSLDGKSVKQEKEESEGK